MPIAAKATLWSFLILSIFATTIGLLVYFLLPNPKTSSIVTPTPTIPIPLNGIQQGAVLIPSDATTPSFVGDSVGLNYNGSVMVTGGAQDNSNVGAAWVYVRSNNTWSQQTTTKLVGSGAAGSAHQGFSVAIASTESKTILSGGSFDNSSIGAAWVFVQSGQTWTQQGLKLVGSDHTGISSQGQSVSLSSDGNTALIGGPADNTSIGASWVFTRSSQTWTQQGSKLIGTGYSGAVVDQGWSVSLSGDGNTALIGAPNDNSQTGAFWVFTRSNQTWTQQGPKMIGSNTIGITNFGMTVSLSGDGNTAMIGGDSDNSFTGAAWVFVRSNNTWTQQGNKLVASDSVAGDNFGNAVSLDVDGNIAVIGASQFANSGQGKFYIFVRTNQTWNQIGAAKVATGLVGVASLGYSISLSSDASTAAVGAPRSSTSTGAVAIFV